MVLSILSQLVQRGNLIEGIVWIVISVCFGVSLLRPGYRWAKTVATINFLVFGLSDFVEMRTGAWWQPWWLLAWKGTCVVVMLVQLLLYVRRSSK